MKKARISELKNQLSEYLRSVRAGQSVVVYDRDRPIARIDPISDADAADDEDWTLDLARRGILRSPTGALSSTWLEHRPRSRGDLLGALLDERDTGR